MALRTDPRKLEDVLEIAEAEFRDNFLDRSKVTGLECFDRTAVAATDVMMVMVFIFGGDDFVAEEVFTEVELTDELFFCELSHGPEDR